MKSGLVIEESTGERIRDVFIIRIGRGNIRKWLLPGRFCDSTDAPPDQLKTLTTCEETIRSVERSGGEKYADREENRRVHSHKESLAYHRKKYVAEDRNLSRTRRLRISATEIKITAHSALPQPSPSAMTSLSHPSEASRASQGQKLQHPSRRPSSRSHDPADTSSELFRCEYRTNQ